MMDEFGVFDARMGRWIPTNVGKRPREELGLGGLAPP